MALTMGRSGTPLQSLRSIPPGRPHDKVADQGTLNMIDGHLGAGIARAPGFVSAAYVGVPPSGSRKNGVTSSVTDCPTVMTCAGIGPTATGATGAGGGGGGDGADPSSRLRRRRHRRREPQRVRSRSPRCGNDSPFRPFGQPSQRSSPTDPMARFGRKCSPWKLKKGAPRKSQDPFPYCRLPGEFLPLNSQIVGVLLMHHGGTVVFVLNRGSRSRRGRAGLPCEVVLRCGTRVRVAAGREGHRYLRCDATNAS